MNRFLPSLLLALASFWWLSTASQAETFKLELKRFREQTKPGAKEPATSAAYLQHLSSPQHFFMQILEKETPKAVENEHTAEFKKIVKTEPKYKSPQPFRGVATLGSEKYAFTLDSKDEKSGGYTRLYFDRNHNGDLTDDKVLEAEKTEGILTPSRASQFPPIDLTVTADAKKLEYGCVLSAYWHGAGQFKYVSASLIAAVYREGDVVLDGKKRPIVLIDANSNGRFDDELKVREDVQGGDGEVYSEPGDLLLVDPDPKTIGQRWFASAAMGPGHPVSKVLCIDGRFYDVKISAAGDTITLAPLRAEVGNVSSAHEGFHALLYSDRGAVKIACDKSAPTPLPAGEWKLLAYSIDRPGWKEPPRPAEKEKEKPPKPAEPTKVERSLLAILMGAVTGRSGDDAELEIGPVLQGGPTTVSATGAKNCPAVKVRAGQTVALPFGPPYKPLVKAYPLGDGRQVRLQLALAGAAGEICDDLMVRGARPAKPEFTIKNPKGEVVETGKFDYG
jgi:hypothetical protein